MIERGQQPGLPGDTVGRRTEWEALVDFAGSAVEHATLGVVRGRRRIGKSYLLAELCAATGGLYYEAVRGSSSEALAELGIALGAASGAPGPLLLPDWETAVTSLMRLGESAPHVVVLDEYPYLREQAPELDSVVQRVFGPRHPLHTGTRSRLILCGSAMSVMAELLAGTSPLRGRAGLDLRISPFDYREAAVLHRVTDLRMAVRLYSIIGGVAAYARDMVDDDLPTTERDFDRWVARRVLSPASPLSREVELLLSEDPTTAQARKVNLYHATLAAIALGRHTPGRVADYVKLSGPRLNPILQALVSAQFVERLTDPIKANRALYHPGDPIIRFHYAIIRPNHSRLGRHGADHVAIWRSLDNSFRSQVVGPTFEAMARHWTTHYAQIPGVTDDATHVGATTVRVGVREVEIDIAVSLDDARTPGERTVAALGEAKSGEQITSAHLSRLESARMALGPRATDARLLLVGTRFERGLVAQAARRSDVELVDLDRLYHGG